MKYDEIKSGIIFGFGLVFAVLFAWFGLRLLGISGQVFSPTELFWFGVTTILAGIFTVSSAAKTHWAVSLGLIALGFYFFARAVGIIDIGILITFAGILSWGASALLVYMTYPGRR